MKGFQELFMFKDRIQPLLARLRLVRVPHYKSTLVSAKPVHVEIYHPRRKSSSPAHRYLRGLIRR